MVKMRIEPNVEHLINDLWSSNMLYVHDIPYWLLLLFNDYNNALLIDIKNRNYLHEIEPYLHDNITLYIYHQWDSNPIPSAIYEKAKKTIINVSGETILPNNIARIRNVSLVIQFESKLYMDNLLDGTHIYEVIFFSCPHLLPIIDKKFSISKIRYQVWRDIDTLVQALPLNCPLIYVETHNNRRIPKMAKYYHEIEGQHIMGVYDITLARKFNTI